MKPGLLEIELVKILNEFPTIRGIQVSVTDLSSSELHSFSFGRTVANRPMDPTVLHQAWCATKPVLALVVAECVLSGLLSLDDSFVDVGEQFPLLDCASFSVGDVLSHNAGLNRPSATDLWMCPNSYRDDLVRSAIGIVDGKAVYSEVIGWLLLSRLAATRGVDVIGEASAILRMAMIDEASLIVDGRTALRLRQTMHLGCGFAVTSTGMTVPLLHEFIPHVVASTSPAMGGLVTAAGLNQLYTSLHLNHQLAELVGILMSWRRGRTWDLTLQRECDFAAGFMVGLADHGCSDRTSEEAFGYVGWMGASLGMLDPTSQLSLAFVHNGFLDTAVATAFRQRLVGSIYSSLGR